MRASPGKHKYLHGEIFAIAGASREHNLIVANVVTGLTLALQDRPCEAYPSDMRIKIPATGLYTYADVSVACSRPEFEDNELDTLLNPRSSSRCSPSRASATTEQEFEQYRTISSLRHYVLVSQDEILVEHFAKQDDSSWLLREARALGRIELAGDRLRPRCRRGVSESLRMSA